MFRWIPVLCLTILPLLPIVAHAGSLNCVGKITDVSHSASGDVRVKPTWRGDWITACNTLVVWKGIPTEVCKRWQAQTLAAQLTQADVRIQYDSTVASACSAMGTLSNADAPSYFITY